MYNQSNKQQDHISENPEKQIQMKIANTESEKEKIYQFRYEVFVEEMSTPVHAADHQNKRIVDELDQHSILIYALAGSQIIATARVTIGNTDQFPEWLSTTFSFSKFNDLLYDYPNKKVGLTTKMAIASPYRGSTIMFRLIAEMYKIYNDYQIQFSFGGGNPRLIQLYERVGYRRFTKNFTEPGYGLLIPLVFIHDDIGHLKLVRSPLYRLFPKTQESVLSKRFYKAFPESTKHINSQLQDHSSSLIQSLLNNNDKYLSPLNSLTKEERTTLIQLGAIIHCTEDDVITTVGEMSNELYFLLSGSLAAKSSSRLYNIYPGQCFGDGISGPREYSEQIIATTESYLLIIPTLSFGKFKQLFPKKSLHLLKTSLHQGV